MSAARTIVAVVAAVLAAPATADAASLVNEGGTLTYTAEPGRYSAVAFAHDGSSVVVSRVFGDDDPISTSGCTEDATDPIYTCPGVTRVVADGGDGDDLLLADSLPVPMTLSGGAGNDFLQGGNAADSLDGGPGDDQFALVAGGDVVTGGAGVDDVVLSASASASYSLDGRANDGTPGEGLNLGTSLEDLRVVSGVDAVGVTLVGNEAPNDLSAGTGPDLLDGGAGPDSLWASDGDDAIEARDGSADRIDCGTGVDSAYVDQFDQVSSNCENAFVTTTLSAVEDRPPTLAWGSVATRLSGSRATAITANVTDDRSVRSVRFLDDERELCVVTAAPFTCNYQPTGGDVGRNTLTAIATDSGGQTSTIVRTVTVSRFAPRSLTLRVSRAGIATGRLRLPAHVTRAQGCSGSVDVSGRRATLRRNCTFRTRVAMARRRYVATFRGNDVLQPKRSPRVAS